MYFMDEIPYMRLFSSRRKLYAPINQNERKKGAAVMLLTRSPVDSTTLMNLPYIHNPQLFRGLYIDRNVNAYIDSGVIVDDDEESVNEAMTHSVRDYDKPGEIKVKIVFQSPSVVDVKDVKAVFKERVFLEWYNYFKADKNKIPNRVTVYVYDSVKEMAKAANKEALSTGEFVLNSYSNRHSIHVVSNAGFRPIAKAEGEVYENYLLNELITYVCMNTSKRCSRYMACQVATVLSGQLSNKLADKIENDWDNISDDSLATSYIIKKMIDAEGPREVIKLVRTGDYSYLFKYGSRKFVKRISGLFEATLSADDRRNLTKDDYGIPEDKKYPMPDESHVRSAIRFFNHVDPSDEAKLARNIKKKIKQFNMTVNVGKDNRFSKYYTESVVSEASGMSDKEKDDIKDIVNSFDKTEMNYIGNAQFIENYKIITYIDIEYVNNDPAGFIVVASKVKGPNGYVILGVKKKYRGKNIAKKLANKMISAIKASKEIDTIVWNIDPGNDISDKLASDLGFTLYKDNNGKKEYHYAIKDAKTPIKEQVKIPLPTRLLTESFNEDGYIITEDYMMCDNFITFFNGMDSQIISEAEKKYDTRLKRYLFKERMRNNKAVLLRYKEMRAMSPWITKTFLKLPLYQRKNIFIDLSYYHGIFLEKLQFKKDIAIKMYWDFVNRLINDSEYKGIYDKITIYIPVYPDAWDTNNAEELMDYKKSINPISMIVRMMRKNPDNLKSWGNKDIIFLSPKGYFKTNFNNFQMKDLAKFKRFITKLVNNEDIEDDVEEDGYGTSTKDDDSSAVVTAKIVDKIEKNMGVTIDDISPGSTIPTSSTSSMNTKFDHLRIRTTKLLIKDINTDNVVFIIAPDEKAVEESIVNNVAINSIIGSKKGVYKP